MSRGSHLISIKEIIDKTGSLMHINIYMEMFYISIYVAKQNVQKVEMLISISVEVRLRFDNL